MRSEPVVYFVRVADAPFVKIGYTTDLEHRLYTIQTGHWRSVWLALVLPGGPELERELHARFAEDHYLGEWFKLSEDIERFIVGNEDENQGLRGAYAWHGTMTADAFEAILAKLNPGEAPKLSAVERALFR